MATQTVYVTKDASAMRQPPDLNSAQTFSGWNGDEHHLPVGKFGSGTIDALGRSLAYFPISFTGVNTIESATLHFMQRDRTVSNSVVHCRPSSGTTRNWFYVYRMVRDWGESPSPAENNWTGGGTYAFTKNALQVNNGGDTNWVTEGFATANFTQSNDHWDTVDVTNIVKAWWNHSKGSRTDAPNYGVIFVNTDETSGTLGIDLYSEDDPNNNIPYITVVYNSNTAPRVVPEATRIPNGSSGTPTIVNTLTPTFSGVLDDPDSNDYITKIDIIVRRVSDSAVMWDNGQIIPSGHPTSFNVLYGSGTNHVTGPFPLSGNTTYKWVVNVMDSGGLWAPWSQYDYFTTNTPPNVPTVTLLESPLTDVATLTPTVVITHNDPDPGDTLMHKYQLIVEKVGSTQIYDSGAVDLTSGQWATTKQVLLPTLTDPDDADAWGTQFRVKAKTQDANNAWGAYSGWTNFTTHRTGVPINLAPADDETTPTSTPTFTGDRASSADLITSYQIILYDDSLSQVWDSGTISTGISNSANFSKAYSGSALTTGTFYQYKVRVTSSIGGTSSYSALKRFKTPSDATVPIQTAPLGTGIQGSGTDKLRPAFTGSRATTFNRFQVEVYPSAATTGSVGSYASGSGVDDTHYWASGTLSATISGTYIFTLAADTIPALSWNTNYKWRARVSADAGSTWSPWTGLASFTMDSAGTPTLYAPTVDQWITDDTPDLTITRAGSDVIDQMRVRVYASNNTTLIWDSGFIDVTEDGSHRTTTTYAGPTLSGGYYFWDAQYQKTTLGPIGNWSGRQRFYLNYAPSVPSEMSPEQGAALADSIVPTFAARFNDNDITPVGDYPTAWEIVVDLNGSPFTNQATITVTSGLVVGVNSYVYRSDLGLGTQTALSYGTVYRWRTRYKDSKTVWGPYSSYQTFKPAQTPNSTNLTPNQPGDVNQVRPTLAWTFDNRGDGTMVQQSINVQIFEVVDPNATTAEKLAGTANEQLVLRANVNKITASGSYQLEANYLQDGKVYAIQLTVVNGDGLSDPTPQINRFHVALDAPDPIQGLAPTAVEDRSVIELHWDVATMKTNHTFVAYNIYKKLPDDDSWQYIGSTYNRTLENSYDDWYAGHGVIYQYKVTVTTTKTGVGVELESGDDPGGGNIAETQLSSDVWMFVGADRNDVHIQELPVGDEGHQRIVQQEAFETLGSNRKVVIRGFVLGHEGTISMTYINQDVPAEDDPQNLINETIKGRRLLDYLTSNKGPHILKSPFGDVWDSEFEGPTYKWVTGGNLQVDLAWTETGQTSMVSI